MSGALKTVWTALAVAMVIGCKRQPTVPPMPVSPPTPSKAAMSATTSTTSTTSMMKRKPNYYLTWTYPKPIPVVGLSFVVLQSNKTSGSWSQLLITNQPPVLLAANLPGQYFQVYPTNSASVTLAWAPPPGSGPFAYVLNAGSQSGNYTITANSHVTNITVTAVWPTNFYCIKAVDTNNLSSLCSNEISYSLPPVFPVSGLAVVRQ